MATAGLTGEGLKKYQRWLAVQRAKGREPAPGEIQSFLQGEIQANIASDTDREAIGLRREEVGIQRDRLSSETDIATRRLDLLEDQQGRQQGADTISGISEGIKGVGALNSLTGGAITKGIQYAAGGIWDAVTGVGDVADTVTDFASIADDFTGISNDILADSFDWSDLTFGF
jgi:hypothetical protein